uniref:Uncharacterized protein n=1 Tax=Amphimedon queenslandica TaxID=400682 RepID=A0A1X7V320_AMPQE
MKKEGCITGMTFLKKKGLDVDVFVTDRHVQITKWMKDHRQEFSTNLKYASGQGT